MTLKALPIGTLKAWALAEVVMAAAHGGRWHALRFEDPAAPPPVSALLAGLELACLLLLVAAIILAFHWWREVRLSLDRRSRWSILAYSLASITSFALWDNVGTLADARRLHAFDAGVSLLALWPALSLIAFIRRTAERP